jgi:restriction system protein
VGPIGLTESDDYLKRRFQTLFPRDRSGWHQVKRFVRDVQIGDDVITYDVRRRLYHIGTIRSDCEIQSRPVVDYGERYEYERWEYVRSVSWQSAVSRDALSVAARNCLNAQLTLTLVAAELSEEIRRRSA